MAVFMMVECPSCHRRLSVSSKLCQTKNGNGCTLNLDQAKRSGKVFYWLAYRLEGKLLWERFKTRGDAEAWRNERTNQMLKGTLKTKADLMPKAPETKLQDTMTIQQLSDWYLNQEYIKTKKSFFQKKNSLRNFNLVFGNRIVSSITVAELKNYQVVRVEKDQAALSTIDQEIGEAKTVIYTAYENDMVEESVRKRFTATKKVLERGSNKRTAIITQGQY